MSVCRKLYRVLYEFIVRLAFGNLEEITLCLLPLQIVYLSASNYDYRPADKISYWKIVFLFFNQIIFCNLVLKSTTSTPLSTQNTCLNRLIRKVSQYFAQIFCLSWPTMKSSFLFDQIKFKSYLLRVKGCLTVRKSQWYLVAIPTIAHRQTMLTHGTSLFESWLDLFYKLYIFHESILMTNYIFSGFKGACRKE